MATALDSTVAEDRAPLWRRAVRRVIAHRGEAAVTGAVFALATGAAVPTHALSRIDGALGGGGAAGIVGALFVGMVVLWLPIAVIDARRCTRETKLRCRVEADLATQLEAERLLQEEHALIEARVEEVLASGGPDIVYQPVVDLVRLEVVGYEALSRFPDAAPPDLWFEQAHRVGRGVDLELAAIRRALQGIGELPSRVYLSVNASPGGAGPGRAGGGPVRKLGRPRGARDDRAHRGAQLRGLLGYPCLHAGPRRSPGRGRRRGRLRELPPHPRPAARHHQARPLPRELR